MSERRKNQDSPPAPLMTAAEVTGEMAARTRYALIGILALALLLRLGFVNFFPDLYDANSDYKNFSLFATNLAHGEGLMVRDGEAVSERMPLYVVFLGVHYAAFGVWPLAPQLSQCFLGVLAVWLSFYLARQVGLRDKLSLLVAAVLAVHPAAIYYSALLISETVAQVLFLLWFMALLKMLSKPTLLSGVWCGVAAGFAVLCRPEPSVFFLVAVPIWLLIVGGSRRANGGSSTNNENNTGKIKPSPRWRLLVTWGVAVGVMLLVLSPWAMRNLRVHGRWRFLYHSSYVLRDGVNPYSAESYNYQGAERERKWREDYIVPAVRNAHTAEEFDRARSRAIWKYVRGHWRELLPTWIHRVGHSWQPWISGTASGDRGRLIFRGVFFIFEMVILLGVLTSLRAWRWWRITSLFWFYILYFTAIHTVYPALVRYRYPFLPVLILLAVLGFSEWYATRAGNSSRKKSVSVAR